MKRMHLVFILIALSMPAFGQTEKTAKVSDGSTAGKPESIVLPLERLQPWENLQLRAEIARKDLQIAQMSVQMAQTQVTAAEKAASDLLESFAVQAGISRENLADYDFSRTAEGGILVKLKKAKPDASTTKKE